MPELPEVEHFRRLLLPLCSQDEIIEIELLGQNHQKKFLTPQQANQLNKEKLVCQSIDRRGKLICMSLVTKSSKSRKKNESSSKDLPRPRYLYIHMGMTGRITTPERVPCFGHIESRLEAPDEYPPRFSYLQFTTASASACFSDPRKFGYVALVENRNELESLAPDALAEANDLPPDSWCNYSTCIKSVMLDQKKVVAGIGNWVADEVLYQAKIHPLQSYLTLEESQRVQTTLQQVLETAVTTSDTSSPYPDHWLFHVRWGKGKKTGTQDAKGRTIKFIDAAGRTSAIVPSIQILSKQGRGPVVVAKGGDNGTKSGASKKKKQKHIIDDSKPVAVKSEASVVEVVESTVIKKESKRKGRTTTVVKTSTKRIKQEVKQEPADRRGVRRSIRLSA